MCTYTHMLLRQGFEQAHRHTEVHGYDSDGENLNEKVYLMFLTTTVIINPIKTAESHDSSENKPSCFLFFLKGWSLQTLIQLDSGFHQVALSEWHANCFGTKSSLKGIVHPKMKILSSFTCMHSVLLNTKEDILKKVCNQAVLGHHWLP